jgi:hypothetical protein
MNRSVYIISKYGNGKTVEGNGLDPVGCSIAEFVWWDRGE